MLIIAEEGGRRDRQVHRHAGLVLEGLPAQGQGQGLQILVSDYIAVHDFGGAFKSSGFSVQGAHGVAPAAVPCM